MSYTADGEWYDDGSTAVPIQDWCPDCPIAPATNLYTIRYCALHIPAEHGTHDRLVDASYYLSGQAEAGGSQNRAFCDLIRQQ